MNDNLHVNSISCAKCSANVSFGVAFLVDSPNYLTETPVVVRNKTASAMGWRQIGLRWFCPLHVMPE